MRRACRWLCPCMAIFIALVFGSSVRNLVRLLYRPRQENSLIMCVLQLSVSTSTPKFHAYRCRQNRVMDDRKWDVLWDTVYEAWDTVEVVRAIDDVTMHVFKDGRSSVLEISAIFRLFPYISYEDRSDFVYFVLSNLRVHRSRSYHRLRGSAALL